MSTPPLEVQCIGLGAETHCPLRRRACARLSFWDIFRYFPLSVSWWVLRTIITAALLFFCSMAQKTQGTLENAQKGTR